ncbi:hypothetical protein EDC94DRAFT_660300 [Helicostylum pulchrum]|nr:hypothetical protein EDC94DRAFT_660300 [Helicostylum pulchrum]
MLEPEASASLVYTILFFLFSIALIGQSLSHWHLTPFALYAICVASGNLYVLLVPEFTSDQRSWRYQEPILNQLPVYSILIFAGIIDWQFVYIRFIATTLRNHKRWGSLHPVIITEKGDATSGGLIVPPTYNSSHHSRYHLSQLQMLDHYHSAPFLFSSWTIWLYISAIIIYVLVILAFLICKVFIMDPNIESLISAIFITVITFPTILNTMVVIYTGSKCHSKLVSRIMGQNRQDAVILFLIPILFMCAMSSTTTIAWMAYTRPDPMIKPFVDDVSQWIVFKALMVYLPLSILLVCCMFKRKSYTNVIEDEDTALKRSGTRKSSVTVSLIERSHYERLL